ncbi:hypothetical protein BGZ65_004244, partial [Modicella reniformis]
ITETSGTARADVAILMIDTLTGEFKSGLEACRGSQQLDVVQWSETRSMATVQEFLVMDVRPQWTQLEFHLLSWIQG